MTTAQQLYRLQQRDQRLDALRKRQRDIQAAMNEPAAVLDVRTAAATAQQSLAGLQSDLRHAELERQTLDEKIQSEEKRLYSGRINNSKEIMSLEQEIASLKRRRTRLDDQMLETMFALEEAQKTQTAATTKLTTIERRWHTHLANLREQLTAVEAEITELEVETEVLREKVAPGDLATYDELRRKKGGRAVAHIVSGRCEGCQVALPMLDISRARQPALAFCSQCGRVLLAG